MLIEQLGPHGHTVHWQRFEGVGTECRVGRALDCDIVVDDDHVAPEHAQLTLLEDGRVHVRDLGSRNGTRVDGERIPAEVGVTVAQGEVVVGRARLRIRTRHTPMAPERTFRREFVRRHRTLLAAAGVAACIAYGVFLKWLDAPSSLVLKATTAALVVLGLIALWSGLWALISKLNRGIWEVRVHVAIASIGAAFCVWGDWVAEPLAFAAQRAVLGQAGVAVVGIVALAALYLHLREATHYGRYVALALAGVATLVIGAIAWTVTIGVDESDVNRVELGPDVRLGAERVVPNRDIAEYLADVEKLRVGAGRERQKSLQNAPLADADN